MDEVKQNYMENVCADEGGNVSAPVDQAAEEGRDCSRDEEQKVAFIGGENIEASCEEKGRETACGEENRGNLYKGERKENFEPENRGTSGDEESKKTVSGEIYFGRPREDEPGRVTAWNAKTEEEEEEEPELPNLPLPAPQYAFSGKISAFGFSLRGESHKASNEPCQDRSSFRFLSDWLILAAVADGVGSCALSHFGANAAVMSSLDYLEKNLIERYKSGGSLSDRRYMSKVLHEAMDHAQRSVEDLADEMMQLQYSYQSTLTVAVYNSDTRELYFAHAGDDGIVAQMASGEYRMVTERHKGEESSSVYPLQSASTRQYALVQDVTAFAMMTDGVMDAVVRKEREKNRVYYPFFEQAFYADVQSAKDIAGVCKQWYEDLDSAEYRERVTDDLTFLCVVNQPAIHTSTKPRFSEEEWDRKTNEYAEERKRIEQEVFAAERAKDKERQRRFGRQTEPKGRNLCRKKY